MTQIKNKFTIKLVVITRTQKRGHPHSTDPCEKDSSYGSGISPWQFIVGFPTADATNNGVIYPHNQNPGLGNTY